MINKIYKRIHNKYSSFFKFVFFLRYLFGIFFVSTALFLIIPNFFNYEKRAKIINSYLFKNYGLKINSYTIIKFNSFPIPYLEIQNASMEMKSTSISLNAQRLIIYPKLVNIYNYENFKAKKIVLNKNQISLKVKELKFLGKYIYNLKNKITLNNLELKINQDGKPLVNLKKINISNYGYKKNKIEGEIFNKKFKIKINDDYKEINLRLIEAGINIDLNLNEVKKNKILGGEVKAKVLKSNLKFNFEYDNEKLKIYNSYFRNKDLSFNNDSIITYDPFFEINSTFSLENTNINVLKNLNIKKFLKFKDFIKKIHSSNTINYKSRKFNRSIIDDLNLSLDVAYGRLIYSTNFFIAENIFNCKGNANLLEEYPILYFNCTISSKNKKKLLKKFSIKYKVKNEPLDLNIGGNVNFLKNKINFNKIKMNNDYEATEEDLKYFKDLFESILLNEDFFDIFKIEKVKEFILEVS